MATAAIDANENSKSGGRPSMIFRVTVGAATVLWAVHCLLDALLWVTGHRMALL
jgi:hypothetical protein